MRLIKKNIWISNIGFFHAIYLESISNMISSNFYHVLPRLFFFISWLSSKEIDSENREQIHDEFVEFSKLLITNLSFPSPSSLGFDPKLPSCLLKTPNNFGTSMHPTIILRYKTYMTTSLREGKVRTQTTCDTLKNEIASILACGGGVKYLSILSLLAHVICFLEWKYIWYFRVTYWRFQYSSLCRNCLLEWSEYLRPTVNLLTCSVVGASYNQWV